MHHTIKLVQDISLVRQEIILSTVFVAGIGIFAGVYTMSLSQGEGSSVEGAYSVPGMPGMTVPVALELSDELTPALLLVVYDAFAQTDENAIYDTLEQVTDGDALEYLYLERVGAMAGGGLEEADQTIHEIQMLGSSVQSTDETLIVDATWQVIGTVGHAEHLHVRGNEYSADISISPVDGAWRITDFSLRDVNRSSAGQTYLAADKGG